MKADHRPKINPKDYLALTNFFRGYLHQDVMAVHGSPIRAAQQFRKDADEREAAVVHAELERLLDETSALSDTEISDLLENFGSSWRFATRQEIEDVRDALK